MTILTTERLTLRHLSMSDAEALHHIHHEAGVWKYSQGASVELGGTGNLPVSPGDQPGEREGAWSRNERIKTIG